jgi:hypothetical protein
MGIVHIQMENTSKENSSNPSLKRDCGTGVAGFLNRLRAAAPYLQR